MYLQRLFKKNLLWQVEMATGCPSTDMLREDSVKKRKMKGERELKDVPISTLSDPIATIFK